MSLRNPKIRYLRLCFTEGSISCFTEQLKANDLDDKKRYDRDFLLGCQFISASMHKPEGLPTISDVVLDKVSVVICSFNPIAVTAVISLLKLFCLFFQVNKTPLRPADPARMMNIGPDFTPSYLGNLGSRSVGGPRCPVSAQFFFFNQ